MSSLYGSSRAVDGTRFTIHTYLTRPSIDAKLWDVRRNRKFNKLCLTGVLGVHGFQQQAPLYLDRDLAVALGDLLCCDNRIWERIEVEHCTGDTDLIVAIGMATGRVQSFCFSEVELSANAFHALATGLKFNRFVNELRFKRCRLTQALPVIADGIRGNPTIQSITLEQCGIVDELLGGFIRSLRECSSLQKLSLEGNICRSEGTAELGLLLQEQKVLNLSLHNQRIEGGERIDVAPIANALRANNSSLKFLDLSRNCLGDEDVRLLMDALIDNNRTLETLHLDQNEITDEGAKFIADALPSLLVLKTLALPENPIGAPGATHILNAIPENYILETFIVPSGNTEIQRNIRWYGNLNKGGRRLFSTPRDAPLAVFPFAIERVNNMPLSHDWNPEIAPSDVIYGLLRLGQLLYEIEEQNKASNVLSKRPSR
jgi:Leucine Rich repeat